MRFSLRRPAMETERVARVSASDHPPVEMIIGQGTHEKIRLLVLANADFRGLEWALVRWLAAEVSLSRRAPTQAFLAGAVRTRRLS